MGMLAANPYVTYHGPVSVWWIPKFRGPRVSLWTAMIAWFMTLLFSGLTLLWLKAASKPLWPFGRPIQSPAEILFRYEIIILVYLIYMTLRSLPLWIRNIKQAKHDASAIENHIGNERWESAALLIHRYCLLVSSIWRRVPGRVATWDGVVRKKIPRHRRLYIYFCGKPPQVPTGASAGFSPEIIPPPLPSMWSAAGVIVVAMLIYFLVMDIVRHGNWQRIVLFNAVLFLIILICYGSYFLLTVLGRANYYRLAPGVIQLVKFTTFRRRPFIETFDLRRANAILDLCSPWPGITLLNTPGFKRETFRMSKGANVTEAFMRAVLSTVSSPPLPEDNLLE